MRVSDFLKDWVGGEHFLRAAAVGYLIGHYF